MTLWIDGLELGDVELISESCLLYDHEDCFELEMCDCPCHTNKSKRKRYAK